MICKEIAGGRASRLPKFVVDARTVDIFRLCSINIVEQNVIAGVCKLRFSFCSGIDGDTAAESIVLVLNSQLS